jgi:tetratricopeptide (TPR) repeat protein
LIRKAEEQLDEGEPGKAMGIVKKILDRKRDYVPARYLKSKILKEQGQYLLAISELNSILSITDFKKHIREIDIHYRLAELYNLTQNWPKEIEEYRIILTFNSDDIKANHRVGHSYYRQKNYRKAREHLLKAISLDDRLEDILLPLGISSFQISDFARAEEFLLKSLRVTGDNTEAQFFLGSIYKMKKDYDNAVIMLEGSRENSSYYLQSVYRLGEIYYENNDHKKGIEILEQGLKLLDEKSGIMDEYRYLLAECYEQENRIADAVAIWEEIAAVNPNFRSTTHKLRSYKEIIRDTSLMTLFTSSLEELQPVIVELISGLNYNIINKKKVSPNEFQYKAFNIKRINEPPVLIYFNRTTREITEGQINEFHKQVNVEKCKTGMYITTSKFSLKAKSSSTSKMIELYDSDFVINAIEKINTKRSDIK